MTHTKTNITPSKMLGISKTRRVLEISEHKEELFFSTTQASESFSRRKTCLKSDDVTRILNLLETQESCVLRGTNGSFFKRSLLVRPSRNMQYANCTLTTAYKY